VVRVREDFEAYVRGQGAALYRAAYLLVGDRGLAEDLVQTVLASAWRRWDQVSRAEHLNDYLAKALANQAVSLRRRRGRRPEVLRASVPDTAGLDTADTAGATGAVMAALAQLPPRQRAVIVLRYYHDLSERDVAATLGVTVGTVKSQSSKAVRSLRASLGATFLEDVHE
jgi:RNA polymerase sigma-70 factor (sigma-E family)